MQHKQGREQICNNSGKIEEVNCLHTFQMRWESKAKLDKPLRQPTSNAPTAMTTTLPPTPVMLSTSTRRSAIVNLADLAVTLPPSTTTAKCKSLILYFCSFLGKSESNLLRRLFRPLKLCVPGPPITTTK